MWNLLFLPSSATSCSQHLTATGLTGADLSPSHAQPSITPTLRPFRGPVPGTHRLSPTSAPLHTGGRGLPGAAGGVGHTPHRLAGPCGPAAPLPSRPCGSWQAGSQVQQPLAEEPAVPVLQRHRQRVCALWVLCYMWERQAMEQHTKAVTLARAAHCWCSGRTSSTCAPKIYNTPFDVSAPEIHVHNELVTSAQQWICTPRPLDVDFH